MSFNRLKQTHQKLAQHPDLSQENKEAITEFLKKHEEKDNSQAAIQKDLSSFNQLAAGINFHLFNCDKSDVRRLVRDLNSDRITKKNGEKFGETSKIGMRKTLKKFYRWHHEQIDWLDQPSDMDWLKVNPNSHSPKLDPDQLLKPKHVKSFVEAADNTRDKALIWTLWSSGSRIGGLVKTGYPSSSPLTWGDVRFDKEKKLVKLDIDDKTGDPDSSGPRTVPVRQAYPALKKLRDQANPDSLDKPVFKYRDIRNYCPECQAKASRNRGTSDTGYGNGKYECSSCSWTGGPGDTKQRKPALTDTAVRSLLDRLRKKVEDVPMRVKHNPHAWRKSLATFKASIGWNQSQICKFFGWVEGSKEAAKYIRLAEQDLEKALFKEYGDEENGEEIDEDLLKPVKCRECGELNNVDWSFCRSCSEELDLDFKMHNQENDKEEELTRFERLSKALLEDPEEAARILEDELE